jgi:hypothetical protein
MTTHEDAQLVTHGWAPGAEVNVYLAVEQEAARANGLAPPAAQSGPVATATADAAGRLDCTVASNTPLLLHGERLDPRNPPWVHSMAHPAWQTPSR